MSTSDDIALFKKLISENRYDFLKLAYIIFPFGEEGHELEHYDLYDWQKEELVHSKERRSKKCLS